MIAHRFFLVCFVLCLLFFSVSVVFAQSVVGEARVMIAGGLKKCLVLETRRDACYAPLCEYDPGYLCAEDILDVAVEVAGPKNAMLVLHDIMASPIFSITTDGHLLSHIIGRATSRVFGSSGEHFLKCPSDFNNGCFHGFFEHTLPRSDSPVDVVASICENMPPETPPKEKGYCYHGAGHVFMMQESHDLDKAIALCLQLPGFGPESCWQGVFMENAGEREWEVKKKNFREDDPLYPCYVVEDRFKPECYINHHGYLIRHHSQLWDELVQMCLGAGDWVEPCIGGLSLMLGSEHWIGVVAQEFEHLTDADHAERTGFFCNRLPDEHISTCYLYAIPSFLNFGHRDLSMVSRICSVAGEEYRGDCFSRIGGYLTNLVSTPQDKVRPCLTVPAEWRSVCLGDEYTQTKRVMEGGLPDILPVEAWQGGNQSSKSISFFERIKGFFASIFKSVTNAFTPTASAHSGDSSDTELVRLAHPELREGVEECLALDGRGDCYVSLCEYEPGYLCAEDLLHTATVTNGPEVGMQMLQEMIAHPLFVFDDANEGHSLAHVVGRITSQHFGGGGEAFLQCPTVLDYGCQHGFLEDALPKASSPAEAVMNICESLPEIPTIGRPNCYHGSGHGVMMNVSYNLHEAIAICDATPDPYSCSTGIMMENASGYVSGRIQDLYPENNSFEENNPQAPCGTLTDTIHRRTCYRQHMPYLAKYFDYDLQEVVDVCLAAPTHTDVRDCVFGFGAYGIYAGIQASFLPGFEGDYMDKIIHMCDQFSEEYRMHCYTPAIDASTIFYGVEQASDFCDKIGSQHLRECYRAIGGRHQSLVMNEEEKIEKCVAVPDEYREECINPHRNRENDTPPESSLIGNIPVSETQGTEQDMVTDDTDNADGALYEKTPFFSSVKNFFANIVRFVVGVLSQPVSASIVFVPNILAESAQKCLALQGEQKERAECYASLCEYEPGYLCAEKILTSLVPATSARDGMATLQDMTWGGAFSFDPSAAHLLAHIIGTETAKRYHLSGEGFLSCPIDFDYGCYHGFLEAGFLEEHTPYTLITQMCETMSEVPAYAKVACYHGSGHALVMYYSYGLYEPLEQCDLLPERWQSICWSGVFMENVNGVNGRKVGDEPDNGFRNDDPFAPCSILDEKYKVLCYENMMPYWLETLRYSLDDLVALCDTVEEGYKGECVHSIGGYSIYLGNQRQLLGDDSEGNFIEKTIYICDKFPEEYRMRCYAPAIQQNFIYHGAEVISEFCGKIDEQYRGKCWEIIGSDIAGKVENADAVIKTCYVAPERYREFCLTPYERQQQKDNNGNVSLLPANETASIPQTNIAPTLFTRLRAFFSDLLGYFIDLFSRSASLWNSEGVADVLALSELRVGVERCMTMDEKDSRSACYTDLCEYEPGYLCAEEIVEAAVVMGGPESGTRTLYHLLASGAFDLYGFLVDVHQLAHVIGRTTVEHWGDDITWFNRCPTDFNYGCYHGFFEVVMSISESPSEALMRICESKEMSVFDSENCYHGGGHGIVMNTSYDLDAAIADCSRLSGNHMRSNCYGGVFMQNALGIVGGEVPEAHNRVQSEGLLTVCEGFERSYGEDCYTYHMAFAGKIFTDSIEGMIDLCLSSQSDTDENVCLTAFMGGLMQLDPVIFKGTFPDIDPEKIRDSERVSLICNRFPGKYARKCYEVNVRHFVKDGVLVHGNLDEVRRFCGFLPEHASDCAVRVNANLLNLVKDGFLEPKPSFCFQ